MLSLQPVKRSRPNDSEHPTTTSSDANLSRHTSSNRKSSSKPVDRASKRRKLAGDTSASASTTRPTSTTKSRGLTPGPSQRLTPSSPAILPPPHVNTIDRYFTSSDEQSEQDRAPVSLYDTIQRRVHDAETKSQDKRTLRSHDDGGRLKSELAVYFPNYLDVINDTPREPELLTPDTVLVFKDTGRKNTSSAVIHVNNAVEATDLSKKSERRTSLTAPIPQSSPASKLNGAQIVDFSIIEKSVLHHPQDPLTDAVYFKPHRRAERKEKQLRNIEKERAMHEKVQLERLLDGLQGHDWLRVMGITGVTDSEAQRYWNKREYFISEVQALVRKFKEWREEEKRLKLEKEAPMLKTEDEAEDEVEDESTQASREPSSSEIDASAARQLQLEASGSNKSTTKQKVHAHVVPVIYRPPTPEGPLLSFFSKPHLRAAALGKARHGRTILAFGHPIPDTEEVDFELPEDYITPEVLKESARRRRRMKRESIMDSSSKTR
ncbi:hypothetical protein B9Z65_799 [Elsinoe australis]|uniref:Something about silencing protein 4 domain-containing protein n=1 Tax=Elsinoe australis TaxID=40998 RepID=A0A2P8AJN3_9PEZI|nr:hypothetical protein B9Z65_799 [Elsinoe australis]